MTNTDGTALTPPHPVNPQFGCAGNVSQTTNGNDNPFVPQNDPTYPRVMFSSYHKADVCTKLQLRRISSAIASDNATLAPIAKKASLKLYDLSDTTLSNPVDRRLAQTVKVNGLTKSYFVDLCVLAPVGVSDDTKGIVIDWEVQDNRDPGDVTKFVESLSAIAHRNGRQLILMTNDLFTSQGIRNGVRYSHNGLDATNIPRIVKSIDGFAPINWSGASLGAASGVPPSVRKTDFASDWCAQEKIMNLSPAQKSKIILNVSLLDLQMNATSNSNSPCGNLPKTLNEPQWIHDRVVNQGYGGIIFWRNGVAQGGTCDSTFFPPNNLFPPQAVNQSIACLVFRKCDGNYSSTR